MSAIGSTDYSPTYVFTMRDAHRRPYQSIRTPALTRHLVFRRHPADFEDEDGWIHRIEAIVLSVFSSLLTVAQPESISPRISNLRQPPRGGTDSIDLFRCTYRRSDRDSTSFVQTPFSDGGRYETAVIHAAWKGITTTIRTEVFDEFFSLTITFELRFPQAFRLTNSQLEERKPYADAYDAIIGAILNRKEQATNTDKWTAAIDNSVETLSSTIWALFNEEILSEAFDSTHRQLLFADTPSNSEQRLYVAEEIIADFRGFLLSLDVLSDQPTSIRRSGPDTEAEEQAKRSARVFTAQNVFANTGGADWADALFPLLIHAEGVELRRNNERRQHTRSPFEIAEYTWSLFDSGRAIYGSGFGPQAKDSAGGSPLQYVLLVAHDDHRSVGRIVNRLHTLGTMRLAALLDFDRVIHRDKVITQLDKELNAIDETEHSAHLEQRHFENFHALQSQLGSLAITIREGAKLLGQNGARFQLLPDRCLIAQREVAQAREQARAHIERRPVMALRRHTSFNLSRQWPKLSSTVWKTEAEIAKTYTYASENLRSSPLAAVLAPPTRRALQKLKADCSIALRSLAVARFGQSVESYHHIVQTHVDKALYSMSDKLRFGIEYRADRSRYYRERFKELSRAMYIDEVPGYQKYDDFVQHRLDRAYSLVISVALRFDSVQRRFIETRRRLNAERSYVKTASIERMQKFAEYGLFFILIPYYLGGLTLPLFEQFTELQGKWPKIVSTTTAFVLASAFYFVLVHWLEKRGAMSYGTRGRSRTHKAGSARLSGEP